MTISTPDAASSTDPSAMDQGDPGSESRVGFDEVLDRLWLSELSRQEQGRRFERLAKRFLEVEPKFADQFSEVWLWNEWPGRANRPDNGIDIVAKDRYTGELTGVQVKFFDPEKKLQKGSIDSFFTELGKVDFAHGMVIDTALEWSSSAEAARAGQSKDVTRVGVQTLVDSTVDWSEFTFDRPEELTQRPRKEPRRYQREAIDDVVAGFETKDRGRLIMACGTGKTFTSLKLVERMVPVGGTVLFMVPSIALLQQTLNEWTANADVPLRPFAVCSDASVGRRRASEDIAASDLGFPASTDPAKLAARAAVSTGDEAVTVVFSTYQSIDVVRQAQDLGLAEFDLVICDEAHRTTGVTEQGQDSSAFTMVHDAAKIRAAKRLYMTATPRIYVQEAKAKAAQDQVTVYSMDDESIYGPEFHRLGFGKAVEQGHLTDYKVLILAVDTNAIGASFQQMLADTEGLDLDDAARIVGCWNGLAKRGVDGGRLDEVDAAPMRRAVAFARNIKESKQLALQFEQVSRQLATSTDPMTPDLRVEASHVDGTFPMAQRVRELDWLKQPAGENTVRVLSNAKCLSEGVDVPTLDAVLFLSPRNSQVDVVQSVGRVMRKADGKKTGYIILPIAVDATADPESALNDSKAYKVVWDVLQALRAHDDRFEAMVNQIALGRSVEDRVQVIGIGSGDAAEDDGAPGSGEDKSVRGTRQALFAMQDAQQWKDAIYARLVRKVGDRRYWEDWAKDVKDIADRHITRIRGILSGPDREPRRKFALFLEGLRGNLNDAITEQDAIEMLSQHLITKPVFEALFEDYSFAAHNPVSQVMDAMAQVLDSYNLETEVDSLEDFYRGVRVRAEGIETAEGKQKIITELYERFFKLAFPRTAESLGIVYTPVQVVDFILRAVDEALRENFGASISDEGVHVLDPFTGTGTFIVRLLQSGLIRPEDLLRKYTQELHANELLLMAYYIAAINIEATFHGLMADQARAAGKDPAAVGYEPFDGIVLTDTFQMTEDGDKLDEVVFRSNNARVQAQNDLDIRVIIGNPPYSVGQTSGNDDNANLSYPTLDASIRDSYAKLSTAQNKNSLYDSYIRAIRWGSNRLLKSANGGVLCYVSNGGYIDGNTADGLRQTLYAEFHEIYVYNLRGNQRTAGEQSRKEGGKIFDSGSRNTVAVLLLVKRPGDAEQTRLHYKDIGDYLDRQAKLDLVGQATLRSLDWQEVTPNDEGDWINQRDDRFPTFQPLAAKGDKDAIFAMNTSGLKTNRDAWVYGSNKTIVLNRIREMITFFNRESRRLQRDTALTLNMDSRRISWSASLTDRAQRGIEVEFAAANMRPSSYRPFFSQHVYFDPALNERRYRLAHAFPASGVENFGFYVNGVHATAEFAVLATSQIPSLDLYGKGGQFFPRYTYAESEGDLFAEVGAKATSSDGVSYTRVDNITDASLASYRAKYETEVTKDDVFYYVYGLLHSPDYRERYAADLKKMLPRIPQVPSSADFRAFSNAGRALSELHIGYEAVEPYPLEEHWAVTPETLDEAERYRVTKMKYGGKAGAWDKTVVKYNGYLTLSGLPEEVQRYTLGSRSAVDWILERYQVKTDKASGIVNDPNDWGLEHGDPRYIRDLLGRIVTVSLETMRIVDALPGLEVE
ncbi:putative helicase [Micrococcus aloeverae]|uniref:Helicase n=1 Tax=Micrococcus aloeverae TaxID=1391911 RepID=A0ABR6DW89_9MICC|nr:type ISP restriction/modification enzyme [Micrococcus aloeverae]MBA9080552.1 putative helicase [Micrococcus aloeverae]